MNDLKGKTVLVTGGARGLGEAVCRRFAAAGCKVVVNDIHGAEKTAAGIGGKAYLCDISDEEAVAGMFEAVGPVDILVNNARLDPYKRSSDITDGSWWEMVMNVNLKGAYLCSKNAFTRMQDRRWGRIINISSIWAYQPSSEKMLSYAAAKSGMHALSRGFALMGAPFGITSNVLAPGLIITEMLSSRISAEMLEKEVSTIPMGRGASADEVAEAVFKIADSPFLTGEIINFNGGALMRP